MDEKNNGTTPERQRRAEDLSPLAWCSVHLGLS